MSDVVDPFAPVTGGPSRGTPGQTATWTVVMPVPADAIRPPAAHPKLGAPTKRWPYLDATGRVLGYVDRYDRGGRDKEFRPLTLWRATTGKLAWSWESWPVPRPLYGLDRLAARPSAPVVVAEGEKAADAAAALLANHVVVSSPNGSKAAAKADWSPLKDRVVVIWPDADAVGLKYAAQVAQLATAAGAASVAIMSPPNDVAPGWDAADALEQGWTAAQVAELVATAAAAEKKVGERPSGRRRRRQKDDLVAIVANMPGIELWRDAGGAGYMTAPVNGHVEHWPLRSTDCRRFVAGINYEKHGTALTAQTLEDVLRTLDIMAYRDGLVHEPFVRVGQQGARLYLDLADERWRAVEITAAGWRVIERPPIKFLRAPSARALPEPEAGDLIERLRRFVNVATDDDFVLVVSWLVATLRPGRPFPILVINGSQGTGKSVLCRLLRLLIDPDVALTAAAPRDERDLVLAAANSWLCSFDNLSGLFGYFPDALCRLATGGGFRTRQLHSDRHEIVLAPQRPILVNGIPMLTEQADVARRSIVVTLAPIAPEQRRAEEDFWQEFERVRPAIIGALLDAVAGAMRNIEKVKLDRPGSMADFEKWITAASPSLGWDSGEFAGAYERNQSAVADETFEGDIFAVSVDNFLPEKYPYPEGWSGTAAEFSPILDAHVPERIRQARDWPRTPAQIGNRIKRARPLLEHKGFTINRRHSGARIITIIPPKPAKTGGAE